jgi:phage shock protein PspC (stress-responsive transcriptional regulator)
MNTDTIDTDTIPASSGTGSSSAIGSRLPLRRPFQGRILTGTTAGLADYFGIDVMLVRIAFVVLTVVGGAGIPLYLAGVLLIPDEGSDQSIASSLLQSFQSR